MNILYFSLVIFYITLVCIMNIQELPEFSQDLYDEYKEMLRTAQEKCLFLDAKKDHIYSKCDPIGSKTFTFGGPSTGLSLTMAEYKYDISRKSVRTDAIFKAAEMVNKMLGIAGGNVTFSKYGDMDDGNASVGIICNSDSKDDQATQFGYVMNAMDYLPSIVNLIMASRLPLEMSIEQEMAYNAAIEGCIKTCCFFPTRQYLKRYCELLTGMLPHDEYTSLIDETIDMMTGEKKKSFTYYGQCLLQTFLNNLELYNILLSSDTLSSKIVPSFMISELKDVKVLIDKCPNKYKGLIYSPSLLSACDIVQIVAKGVGSPFYIPCFHTGYVNWEDCLEVAKNEDKEYPTTNVIYIIDTSEFNQFTMLYTDRNNKQRCLVSCYNLYSLQSFVHNKDNEYIVIRVKVVSHYDLHNIHTLMIDAPHHKFDFGTFLTKRGSLYTNKMITAASLAYHVGAALDSMTRHITFNPPPLKDKDYNTYYVVGTKVQVITYWFPKTIVQPSLDILKGIHERRKKQKVLECTIIKQYIGGTNIYYTCLMKFDVPDEELRLLNEKILSFNMDYKPINLYTAY